MTKLWDIPCITGVIIADYFLKKLRYGRTTSNTLTVCVARCTTDQLKDLCACALQFRTCILIKCILMLVTFSDYNAPICYPFRLDTFSKSVTVIKTNVKIVKL